MKLAKLSLAAIMTVGAISAANATSLEEAIQGVNLSGYARYRFDDTNSGDHKNSFKASFAFTTPVVENVNLVTRFEASGTADDMQGAGSSNDELDFNKVYITYTPSMNLKVLAGKMGMGSPLDDSTVTGVRAMYTVSNNVSLTAGYFDDIMDHGMMAGVDYSSDMFGARAWYVTTDAVGIGSSSSSFLFTEASASFAGVNTKIQYASADKSGTDADTMRISVDGKVGSYALKAGYITNDSTNGDVTVDGVDSGDTSLIAAGWTVSFNDADADYMYAGVSTNFGKVGASLEYVDASGINLDSETTAKLSYTIIPLTRIKWIDRGFDSQLIASCE